MLHAIERKHIDVFKRSFKDTIPVSIGYIPLGFAFGILMQQQLGESWYISVLMSLLIYAGAAQFAAIGLIVSGSSLFTIGLMTTLINMRHIFYGVLFFDKIKSRGLKKLYMIFGLTDEAFSTLIHKKNESDQAYFLAVIAFSHFYWVLGTLLGATVDGGNWGEVDFLKFSLTALFFVILFNTVKTTKDIINMLASVAISISFFFVFEDSALLTVLALSSAVAYFINKVTYSATTHKQL